MVARNMHVQSACGWFSERSTCFLASGRPVIAQDTGIADLYPNGEGLLLFTHLDEALAAIDAITTDYERHCEAAREIAEACFDSDKVIGELLDMLSSREAEGAVR